jgi:hypothetical protein
MREIEPPDGGVLSTYLDTSVNRIQGQAYLLAFRDTLRSIRTTLVTAPPSEHKTFQTAAERALFYIEHEFVARHLGSLRVY